MKMFVSLLIALMAWTSPGFAQKPPIPADAFDLEAYSGRVVYVDFWASWCGPCRQSFPFMREMQEKYADQGLTIIAVNVDEDSKLAHDFLSEVPHNFTVVMDPKGQLAEQYQLMGMPSSYLIGRDGKQIESHTGFRQKDRADLEAKIQHALTMKHPEHSS